MTSGFKKTKENFVCDRCGTQVIGNGYTNHCPNCLWSKHVDIRPGDRASDCKGLMKPIEIVTEGGEYSIIHQCEICAHKQKNKISPSDNFQEIIKISQRADQDNDIQIK